MVVKRLDWTDWVCLAVLAATLFVAFFYVPFGWEGFGELFNSSAAANWVQALGSLIALVVAIWLPMHMRNRERTDAMAREAAESYVVALTVVGMTKHMIKYLEFFIGAIAEHRTFGTDVSVPRLQSLADPMRIPSDDEIRRIVVINVQTGASLAAARSILLDILSALRASESLASLDTAPRDYKAMINYLLESEHNNATEGKKRLVKVQEVLNGFIKEYAKKILGANEARPATNSDS